MHLVKKNDLSHSYGLVFNTPCYNDGRVLRGTSRRGSGRVTGSLPFAMSVTGRGCALELVADAPAADVRSRRACGQRHSAWAVSLAILSCSVSVATADFIATRPLAGTPGNGATRGITVPRVTPVGSLNGNGVGAWVGGEAMTSTTIMTHSPEFLTWALKHDKLVEYCSGSKPPCEESLHRESIWRTNAAAIEAHNNQGGSLMKKGLTRFADLTEIEFTAAHATYAGGVPVVAPPRKQETYGAATVTTPRRVGAAESSSETEALISLKLATDEAARRGEALPSDDEENELWEQDAPSDAVLHQAMVNSPFPALGASAGLTAEERRNQARERRREQRAAERAAREEQIGFGQGEENEQKSGPLGSGLPNHFDWSDQLDFGEIVHQGACAGCWAYSTAAVVEAARFVDNGSRERMSPYSLIDCDALDHGCATGNMASAYAWIQTSEFGLPPLERYPSLSVNGQCSTAGLGASLGAERFTPDGVEKGATGDETDDDKSSEPLKTSALGSVMPNLFGGDSANQKDKRGNKLNKDGTPIHIPSGNARTKGYCDLPVLHKDAERQLLRALAQQPVAVGTSQKSCSPFNAHVVYHAVRLSHDPVRNSSPSRYEERD